MIAPIAAQIAAGGALPLARAMALAADHYYATKEPFGSAGDFMTAPEISQIFGELVGLFLVDFWQRAGAPPRIHLAEFGPGRGTLMLDAMRAARAAAPTFVEATTLHLVERSARLRAIQAAALPQAMFHDSIASLPADAPLLVVANEFLDALPLTQFVRTRAGWALRAVGQQGWDLSTAANPAFLPEALRAAPVGAVHERNFAAEALVASLARRLAEQGGGALFIDYGYVGPALGDTLQALQNGQAADPLATLGEADISAHVDFARVADVARPHVAVHGPVDQGVLLLALGARARADRLKAGADLETRAKIEAAFARLTGAGAMGRLFKAIFLAARHWPRPAGFPSEKA